MSSEVNEIKSLEDLPEPVREEYENLLDQFAEDVGQGRILDAGCGWGKDVEYFVEEHNLDAVGVDNDKERIEYAKKNKPGEYHTGDVRDLSEYEDGEFNGVWCNTVMQFFHPDEMEEIVSELDRVLESGGIFYTTFKLEEGVDESDERVSREGDYLFRIREDEDRRRYLLSEDEAIEKLTDQGYEVLNTNKSEVNGMTVLGAFGEKPEDSY